MRLPTFAAPKLTPAARREGMSSGSWMRLVVISSFGALGSGCAGAAACGNISAMLGADTGSQSTKTEKAITFAEHTNPMVDNIYALTSRFQFSHRIPPSLGCIRCDDLNSLQSVWEGNSLLQGYPHCGSSALAAPGMLLHRLV